MIFSKQNIIDKPRWRPITPWGVASSGTTAGQTVANDHRNRNYADPYRYMLNSGSTACRYNIVLDSWQELNSPVLAGSFGRGAVAEFAGSQGPKGTLAAGGSTTKIVLSTALPASVGVNQLANRGDDLGFIVRIIGNAGGSSGKTEERRIISNTSGTTPTIYLDQPLSFTPAAGDAYEFLSGRVYYLTTGVPTSGMWKYYDVLTGSYSASLSITNLPTVSATWNEIVPLDEGRVPYSRFPGEGFVVGSSTYDTAATVEDFTKKCLLATNSAAGTLTGQAADGDANVLSNEYRNFQIRIVEDTAIPTAVGQRRRITSHTAGASPVYTLASNWTVTPSTTCKFVIENDNDKLILFVSGATTIYNYNHTANTWDTTTWAARSVAMTIGPAYQQFGIDVEGNRASGVDIDKNQRNSHIISIRSGVTYDILDISGGATGAWTNALVFPHQNIVQNFILSSSSAYSQWVYDPIGNGGKYVYVLTPPSTANGNLLCLYRIDLYSKTIHPYSMVPMSHGLGGGVSSNIGNRSMFYIHYDENRPITFVAFGRPGSSFGIGEMYELMII